MKYNWLFFIIVISLFSCNKSKARRPINKQKNSKSEYSIRLNKLLQAQEEKNIKNYIEKDTLDYMYSPYGFAFSKIKTVQNSVKAKEGSVVTYVKTVSDLKNKVIYDTVEKTIMIGKSNEIKGIEQGLKLMQEDEEIKFIFSSFVSYGFSGDSYKIGTNTPLVINIKLLKIK